MGDFMIAVRELAGWDLDVYPYRPHSIAPASLLPAKRHIVQRVDLKSTTAPIDGMYDHLRDQLKVEALRPDLQSEMAGLEWTVDIVDLRCLLAFQRRVSFDPSREVPSIPDAQDWSGLINLCFGAEKQVVYQRPDRAVQHGSARKEFVLTSNDPNLQIRTSHNPSTPLTVHMGSPFFEVAEYRGRWFLRDGYHRAYRLLRNGIFHVPTVVVRARTLEELGATRPWFFSEEILFCPNPPRVIDFLDDALVLTYSRPPLIKTFRVTIEESLEPAAPSGDPS